MSHIFCRTQKKQKKKILLYRKLWKKRQHQLTLFCACRAKKPSQNICQYEAYDAFFCTHYYPCVRNKYMRNYKKMQDFFACFARRQIQHINHVQKTYKERKKKNGKKKKRQKRRTGRTGTVK